MTIQLVEDSIDAFVEGRDFRRSNMVVERFGANINMFQHGNLIAQRPKDGGLYKTMISCAGWYTVTTKARLDSLLYRVTMGAWGMGSQGRGDWVLHSFTHGESKPFYGVASVEALIDLDETIINERIKRETARSVTQ